MPLDVTTTCTLDCPERCSIICHREGGSLLLRSDRFIPVDWETAYSDICQHLEEALGSSPASAVHLRGSGSLGASKAFTDRVFTELGARGARGSLCAAAGDLAVTLDTGALHMNDPRSIDRVEAIVPWSKNPSSCSIHTATQVRRARRRGVPVVSVNPDAGALDGLSDAVVQPRPGSDRHLALAVAKLFLLKTTRDVPWLAAANSGAFADDRADRRPRTPRALRSADSPPLRAGTRSSRATGPSANGSPGSLPR